LCGVLVLCKYQADQNIRCWIIFILSELTQVFYIMFAGKWKTRRRGKKEKRRGG